MKLRLAAGLQGVRPPQTYAMKFSMPCIQMLPCNWAANHLQMNLSATFMCASLRLMYVSLTSSAA